MTAEQLFKNILSKRSFLCVGLDSDTDKLPESVLTADDPVFEFNKAIIDATAPYCVAYKPNTAFYEARGSAGWASLEKTIEYIGDDHFVIADAKRGDIGNTSRLYATAFFEQLGVDALTVAPYMGRDSVEPFCGFDDKWVILLALTSNPGSADFQFSLNGDLPLYEQVMQKAMSWAGPDEMMFVTGATNAGYFDKLRSLAPDHFFLVPGIGAQGGDLEKVAAAGMNKRCGLLVNSSRGIIYASNSNDYALAAGAAARDLQQQMHLLLTKYLPLH